MNKELKALENIIETFIDKDSDDIKTVRKALEDAEQDKKALEILRKHIVIVKCIDGTELFDLDLWNTKKQKEEYEFIKKYLNIKNVVESE